MRFPQSSVLLVVVVSLGSALPATAQEPFRYPEGKHGNGELRYRNNLPVLQVEGTPAEIGEQVGVLAIKPAGRLLNMTNEFVKQQGLHGVYPVLLRTAGLLSPRFPKYHLEELAAMAKAAGRPRDLFIFANTMPDMFGLTGCSAVLVEGKRSTTGKPLFGRNLDWPPFANLHEYALVTVFRPKGKHAFVSIGYPGMIGCATAMNDSGLSLAHLTVRSAADGSARFNLGGEPSLLLLRRIMEECKSIKEAEELLRGVKRATMFNLAICDKQSAATFEVTPKSVVVRPAEDGICACTNHFRSKELATNTECWRFDRLQKGSNSEKLGPRDVEKLLHAVNQGKATMQSMIFEPADLKLHLALGAGPATALPKHTLELRPLFRLGD